MYLSSSENIKGIILTCCVLANDSLVTASRVASELLAVRKPVGLGDVSVTVIIAALGLATVKLA